MNTRREFLKRMGLGTLSLSLISGSSLLAEELTRKKMFFDISLAEWSLNNSLFSGKLTNLDFPEVARKKFDIHAVEYVNRFFKDKANDQAYLKELLQRSKDNGVTNVLIMVDGEGNLGATDTKERLQAVENHYKWVEAAKFLGCHSIRVNAAGKGTPEEVKSTAIDGLGRLSAFAEKMDMNVIVENHGSYSSYGDWLVAVMQGVNRNNCGTLPDFGNFYDYNRYQGVQEMMPYAKGVSAKTYDFDANGNETKIDYGRMLKIVKNAGYTGHIGIEYEGKNLSEEEGIRASKALLQKIGSELS